MTPCVAEAVLEKIFTTSSSSLSKFQGNSAAAVMTIFPDTYTDVLSSDKHPQLMNILRASEGKRKHCLTNHYTLGAAKKTMGGIKKSMKIRDNAQHLSWTEQEIEEIATRITT